MTALDKVLAAFDADKVPAPGTMRDALSELDRHIDEAQRQAREWSVIRGKLEIWANVQRTLGDVRAAGGVQLPAPVLSVVRPMETTVCSVPPCVSPARAWDRGTPYCKRHARERGVLPHGKIGGE